MLACTQVAAASDSGLGLAPRNRADRPGNAWGDSVFTQLKSTSRMQVQAQSLVSD